MELAVFKKQWEKADLTFCVKNVYISAFLTSILFLLQKE